MKLIYELDVPDYETMNERDPMCPALWRYRKKITIEHLSFKFQEYSQGCNQQDKCEVLAEFLEKVLAHANTYDQNTTKNSQHRSEATESFFCFITEVTLENFL